jgi:hypothetical protein
MSTFGNVRIACIQDLLTVEDDLSSATVRSILAHRGWEKRHFGVADSGHDAMLGAALSDLMTPAASADSSSQPQVCALAY